MKSIQSKKKLLKNGLLYLILDKEVTDQANIDILSLADKSAKYGVDILQLRTKKISDQVLLTLAQKLQKIISRRKKIFIVNDRVDIAYLSGACGLHLGSRDIPVSKARKILGQDALIGKTVHSLGEFIKFKRENLNYLSLGPVFKTKTKPELKPRTKTEIKTILGKTAKVLFAIGGINLYNIDSLLRIGINNVAICRGIIFSKNLKSTIEKYKLCLRKAS